MAFADEPILDLTRICCTLGLEQPSDCGAFSSRSFQSSLTACVDRFLLVAALVLLGGMVALNGEPAHAQSSSRPLQASDVLNVREIRDVSLSPSGRNIAYTARQAVTGLNGSVTDQTRLYVAPSHGRGSPHLLTRSGLEVSHPAWHPDGEQIAFVRPVAGTPQVFVLSLSGGEAYQLTDLPSGATHPQWSPSGDRLLFASAVPESDVRARSDRLPPIERPGRTPGDTVRRVPPDTILVLRHERTLNPVDTLAYGPEGQLRLPSDTARTLRSPGGSSVPDSLLALPLDSLRTLTPDSLQTVFRRLRLLPDTTLVPVPPDTAATPDGDLLQMRRWLDQRRKRGDVQIFTRSGSQEGSGVSPTSTYRHYYLVDVPNDIYSGVPARPPARPVTRGYRSYHGAVWMPGGSQIVVSAPPPLPDTTTRHPDRDLYVVDLYPYRIQRLLDVEGLTLTDPRITSDGTTLAFRAQNSSTGSYTQADIGLFELDGRSAPQIITANFDHDVSSVRWSPDGWYLYATAPTAMGTPLYRFAPFARTDTTSPGRQRTSLADDYETSRDTFALDSLRVRTAVHNRMLAETRTVQAYDVTDSKAIYAAGSPQTPSEIYSNTISFNNERRLSSLNADWVGDRSLATAEQVSARSGNVIINGRLTKPLTLVDSLRYPLVVAPRGGPPTLQSETSIPSWFERHFLAGRGFAVLEVWPRGSDGFGETFRRQNFQNWGPGPARDVLVLTDSVLARTWIDSTRQVVAGRSYGAYLTGWLVGHTDRFRAAVALNGAYDLPALFDAGTTGPLLAEQFGGYPWEPTATPPPGLLIRPGSAPLLSVGLLPPRDTTTAPRIALRRNSPLPYAHRIETPLLLMHGGSDARTGSTQSESLYRRLQILGRPVEYARYPNAGHNFWSSTLPEQRMDRVARLHEFLSRYTSTGAPVPPPQAASP